MIDSEYIILYGIILHVYDTYISFNGPRQCVSRVILVVSNLCMGGYPFLTAQGVPPPHLLPLDIGPNIGQSEGREERCKKNG